MKNKLAVVILAAGKGTRMRSSTPKVLHELCGRPMLSFVTDLAHALKAEHTIAVLGHQHELVRKILAPQVKVAVQKDLNGTAGAVKAAMPFLKSFKGDVLILYGDVPLLKKESLTKLLAKHRKNSPDATLLTSNLEKPAGYGRILRDAYSSVSGIVEEKDANDYQKSIKEVNTGIALFRKDRLESALKSVRSANRKKEFYLTDTFGIIHKGGGIIDSVKLEDFNEALGINSRSQLAQADAIMRKRIVEEVMESGVTVVDPATTFIYWGSKIGRDTVIYPFTVIERNAKIGKRCFVGPFAHLRESVALGDDVIVGNFIEITRSKLGAKTIAKHFSYIGDSRLGRSVNIGAGTVTANFDGLNKHDTIVKDNAFIGSDTVLVSPVVVGRNASTAAGSVVVHRNVPDGTVFAGVPAKFLRRKK